MRQGSAVEFGVIEAFLRRETSNRGGANTDGSRLYAGGVKIAEWKGGVLSIVPTKGSAVEESHKDALVDFILRKIQREEILWELVRPGATSDSRNVTYAQ